MKNKHNNRMGIFDKKVKKLRKEFSKKNIDFCKETVKELEELHEDLKAAYADITVIEEFIKFTEEAAARLDKEDQAKLDFFTKRFGKLDKVARDAVREVREILRSQKKKLREASQDE